MLKDILKRIADKPPQVPLPENVRRYLEQHQIPADIIEDLAESCYDGWISVGPVDVIPMPRLIEVTEGIAVCMQHGLLPIAGCRNFDPVVVHRVTRRVSYVSYELLYADGAFNIDNCLQESPFAYEVFWDQAQNDPAFPYDSYIAGEVWGK